MTVLSKKQRKEQKKMDRRNKANQLRRNKKDMVSCDCKKPVCAEASHLRVCSQVLTEKRRLGSRDGPPHLVVVVSLHASVDAAAVTKRLRLQNAGGVVHQEQCVSGLTDSFGLIVPRFKQRFIFVSHTAGKYGRWSRCYKQQACLFVT